MNENEVLSRWIAEIYRRVFQGTGRPFSIPMDDVIKASGATLPDKGEEDALKVELGNWLEAKGLIIRPHLIGVVPDLLALTSKGADPNEWPSVDL